MPEGSRSGTTDWIQNRANLAKSQLPFAVVSVVGFALVLASQVGARDALVLLVATTALVFAVPSAAVFYGRSKMARDCTHGAAPYAKAGLPPVTIHMRCPGMALPHGEGRAVLFPGKLSVESDRLVWKPRATSLTRALGSRSVEWRTSDIHGWRFQKAPGALPATYLILETAAGTEAMIIWSPVRVIDAITRLLRQEQYS